MCARCSLRFDAQDPRCPRCGGEGGAELPGYEFGGFLATRDDSAVLEEEDRISRASYLRCWPQWNGQVVARYELPTRWHMEIRTGEVVRWLNEWREARGEEHACELHSEGRGFYLCPACGRLLKPAAPDDSKKKKGHKKLQQKGEDDAFGHARGCRRAGEPPIPLAITTSSPASTLRFIVTLPLSLDEADYRRWGLSLGFALRSGLRHVYMLDGSEVEFELEGPWDVRKDGHAFRQGALTFIDTAIGGSGFLDRAAVDMPFIARAAVDHLDHENCDTACYRCLKSYQNQRFHSLLSWPHAMPDLEALASAPPRRVSARRGDSTDPGPWLEAYDAGVGSPLELKFLRLLQAKGITVAKQVPLPPERPISIADFAIVEKRVAIYIDGAAFHQGMRLRRDRRIRERLASATPPWRVVTLTARDLATGLEPLRDLMGEFPEAPEPEPSPVVDDPPTPEPESTPSPTEGYEVLEPIGGGGMAECYRARDRVSGALVFLKRVRVGSADSAALDRELEVYGRLQHHDCPHVLTVLAATRDDDYVSLVTELADDGDLRGYVDGKGKGGLPAAEALAIGLEIALGLCELKEANVVHRDLKPENVLRAGGTWKLADFGIAKNTARNVPGRTFQQAGTFGYAAPEQIDEPTDAHPSADVYSFGKVLTFLLTGNTDADKIRLADWRRLVFKCVAQDPALRPKIEDVRRKLDEMSGNG